eukprot:m.168190 g.168190  ORF g.168190 m.168190 type:complete len:304 (-) comp31501_c1_seq1:97-1008(-)
MLAAWILGAAVGIGFVAGILIGAVGVGGIVIVPSLIEFPGISAQTAIAASMFSYMFVGIAGGIAYVRKSSVVWPSALWICCGATPGGFVGAFVLQYIGDLAIKVTLYSLVLVSAIFSLYRTINESSKKPDNQVTEATGEDDVIIGSFQSNDDGIQDNDDSDDSDDIKPKSYQTTQGRVVRVIVGFVCGLGSALTGTSGPVVLLPMLLSLNWDVLDALGSAQVVQFPIAGAATVAYVTLRPGTIDFVLGGCLAAGLVPSAFIGAWVAHSIPVKQLKIAVSVILVLAAGFLIGKLLFVEYMAGNL